MKKAMFSISSSIKGCITDCITGRITGRIMVIKKINKKFKCIVTNLHTHKFDTIKKDKLKKMLFGVYSVNYMSAIKGI